MLEIITKLKTILPAKKLIVTGSYALSVYGLVPMYSAHDLDIILVDPEPAALITMENLMKDFPARTKPRKIEEQKKYNPEDEEIDEDFAAPAKKHSSVGYVKPVGKPNLDQNVLTSIFLYDGVKVDIYVGKRVLEPTLCIDGIYYSTILHIVDAKKSYNRVKDWLQLREISKLFFIPEEFNKALDKDWKDMIRQDY
jgi:hypothetical protein